MNANETGEWIFSDEGHEWMDERAAEIVDGVYRPMQYRTSGETALREHGWAAGFYSFRDSGNVGASWPVPLRGSEV